GKSFRGIRACSRHRDTESSATRKSVPVTSPESVYSQRCPVTCGWRQAGTASVATPSPRHGHPLHGRDRQHGHRDEKSPGSRSRPLDPVLEQSHEATSQKRSLEIYLLAQPG